MEQKDIYTCAEIEDGIRNSNREVLLYIYKKYFPIIRNIIIKEYGGTHEHARDVFQDAMVTVYTGLISNPPLKISSNFLNFLCMVCKRRMIDELRKKSKESREVEVCGISDEGININEYMEKEEKMRLFEKHFHKLGEKCRQLLSLFLNGLSTKEITNKLKMSSEQFTKKRRLQCKISLFKSIFTDSTLRELIDGKPWTIREIPKW